MYFCISCSFRWFPTPITTERRSATWYIRDKLRLKSSSLLVFNTIAFYTLSCVYLYTYFVKITSISMLFESLNFDDSIESGVACRPFCLPIEKNAIPQNDLYIALY